MCAYIALLFVINLFTMKIDSFGDGVEDLGGFGLSESLDVVAERGLSMLNDWEKANTDFADLLVTMCATSGGPGITMVGKKGTSWIPDLSRFESRIENCPGAAVLRLTDIDLIVIVESPRTSDREDLMDNQEYRMTKDEFLAEMRKRL